MPFTERLKELRKERNLTQDELGDAVGLQRVNISHYEKGNRWPQVEGLIALAQYFGVTTDYLLGISDYRNYPKQDVKTIAGKLIMQIEDATEKAKNQLAEADQHEESQRRRKRLSIKGSKVKTVGGPDHDRLATER